jgi:hypothetical protein
LPRVSADARRITACRQSAPPVLQRVLSHADRAWAAYRPRFYRGKITFPKPAIVLRRPDPAEVWGQLARDLEIRTVAGDHRGMMRGQVDGLAARLSACLGQAVAACGGDAGPPEHAQIRHKR